MSYFWGRTSLVASLSLIAGLVSLGISQCESSNQSLASGERSPASENGDYGGIPVSLLTKEDIANSVGPEIAANRYPDHAKFEVGAIPVVGKVEYGFDPAAQEYIEKVLSQYRPDYGVFVAMDARTGRIIALANRS